MEQMSDGEFVCRKCRRTVSSEQYRLDSFCPDCRTLLIARRRPKYWVFQFNPAIYGWFDWIKENRGTEQWLTTQHAREIHEGDKVAIWSSGHKLGVYAIGEIVANPSIKALNQEQVKYFTKKEDVDKFLVKKSVIVKYLKIITHRPLLEDECREDPILSVMEIMKHLQGTNFSLIEEQWNRILEQVDKNTI